VREKEAVINELTQQIEELDFTYKNIRAELEAVREETSKKDSNKTKLINELREQIEYQLSSISVLENS
jgi:archaellum component FlaC